MANIYIVCYSGCKIGKISGGEVREQSDSGELEGSEREEAHN